MLHAQALKLLALETSTDSLSLAVQAGAQCFDYCGLGGAQASIDLIPAIQDLMRSANLAFHQLDAIVFGAGPGSFTGLRTACAVAQGLALGAGCRLLPVSSLLALAETARHHAAPRLKVFNVLALLDARMDEIYVAGYGYGEPGWTQTLATCLVKPEDLAQFGVPTWAGNVFAPYGPRLNPGSAQQVQVLPCASALLRLAPALLASGADVAPEHAVPVYVRDKVAQTMAERGVAQLARGLA